MASGGTADATVVVVTFDGLPWIERCLESVAGSRAIVVDCGSRDGTVATVRSRFPAVTVIEVENRGLGAAWNVGIKANESRYTLLLNADAWLVGNALSALVEFADRHPEAAIVGPRLSNPDGSLQRSVRGFPTLWRLATEYFFLRKLARRSDVLNSFYGGGFAHDAVREVEFVMGACMLLRREAIEQVGYLDEDYFLFSEETDLAFRCRAAGWKVFFYPGAACVHVGGASHGGRLYRENLRGHLLFLWKHRGPRQAERARRLLLAAVRLRGILFTGERARTYREAARWLSSGNAAELLER
jgi:N-acetylglucosaminyl-diphospho-decaprenol L-rhamnosyltransferase